MDRRLPPRRFPFLPRIVVAALLFTACGGGDSGSPTSPGNGGGSGTTVVTPAAIKLLKSSFTLDRWADTATVVATVVDANGSVVPNPPSVTLTSSDTSVVKVSNATGKLTTWKAGTATITASAGGFSATAQVTVTVQRNTACHVPEAPSMGPAAAPYSFRSQDDLEPGTQYWGSAAIPFDVDQDGDMDVIQLDQDPVKRETYTSYTVFLNEGGAMVRSDMDLFDDGSSPFNGPRDYAVADVNGDGRLDLYVAQPGYDPGGTEGLDCSNVTCEGAGNLVLLAKAGGGFENASTTALVPDNTHGFTHAGDLADVDCDGDPDLIQANWPNEQAPQASNFRLNTGGVFAEAGDRIAGGLPPLAGSSFCDVDQDGDPDLILAPAPGELALYVNDGFGRFRTVSGVFPPSKSGPAENINSDLSCGDLTGDGLPEIVAHDHSFNANFGQWVVLKNQGDLTFTNWNEVLPDPSGTYFFNAGGGPAMMYDFNQDGWMDLLGGGDPTVPMQVLFNTGGNGFTSVFVPSYGGGAAIGMQPAVADFDGDGRLDLYLGPGHGYPTVMAWSH